MDNYNKAIDDMIAHFRTQLKGSPTQGEVHLEQIRAELNRLNTKVEAAEQDVKIMNWLDKNIHSQQMDDFDRKHYPNSWQWMIWAPKNVQGSARAIVGAAMARDEE